MSQGLSAAPEEYSKGLEEIWENKWLTNNGPILKRFTQNLCNFFETDNLTIFNNGTLALQIALQGVGISGEVITTHSLCGNNPRVVLEQNQTCLC